MTVAAFDAMPCGDAREVLAYAREQRRVANEAAAREMAAVARYAALNAPDPEAGVTDERGWVATWQDAHGGDTDQSLAGAGAPDVSEFAVLEVAAALGMTKHAGRAYVAEAIEVTCRLPRLWAAVWTGTLPAWKARLVAKQTTILPAEGAAEVDTAVAAAAHQVGPVVLGRLVAEALARHDPVEVERRRAAAARSREVRVHLGAAGADGIVGIDGYLDLADAHALEEAIQAVAAQLAANGSEEPMRERRATALGVIARRQLDPYLTEQPPESNGRRELVLHLHAAVTDAGASGLARVDEAPGLDGFIGLAQVRDWCADPDTQITVKPVIDLNAVQRVDAYEIPDRIHAHVKLRDGTCRFPWCTTAARWCQSDHMTAHRDGGETSTDNLASLCPSHHRLKTHQRGWTYRALAPATYLWTSPLGRQWLVDPSGTLDLGP